MDLSKKARLVVPGVDVLAFNIPRFCWLEWHDRAQTLCVSVHEAWWPALVARIAWIHKVKPQINAVLEYREPPEVLHARPVPFGFGDALHVRLSRLESRVHIALPYHPGMGLAAAYSLAEVVHAIAFASLPIGHGRTREECESIPSARSQMIVVGSMVVSPLWKAGGYRLDVRLSSAARDELKALLNDRDVHDLQDTVKGAMLSATARLSKKAVGKVPEKCDCVVDREEGRIRLARRPDFQHRDTEGTFGEHFQGLRLTGTGENTVSGQLITLAGFAALDHWLVQNATVR